MTTESRTSKLYRSLILKRERLTARQIASRYRVANPYDLVYRLRNEGHEIYSDKIVNSHGKVVTQYTSY
jgi:Helix-turn-helix domain